MTYKLVITSGSGPSRKVESKEYWMTQVGLHQAEAEFEKLQRRQDVMKLVLWRVDIKGVDTMNKVTFPVSKVTLTRYINDNGKTAYVVSYNGKYGILTDLSEQEAEQIESTFSMVVDMCVEVMGKVESDTE